MKKSLLWLLIVLLAVFMVATFSLAGCKEEEAAPAEEETVEEAAPENSYKFIMVTHAAGHTFFPPVKAGMTDAANLLGVEADFIGPIEYDVAAHVDMLSSAIEAGVDGLATSLPDAEAYNDIVQKAMDKGIPVVAYNTDAPGNARMAFVGQEMIKAGMIMGEEIKKSLPNGGKVMLATCCPGHLALEARMEGVRQSLEGSNVTIVGEPINYGSDLIEAVSKVEAAHLANPDINGIYGVEMNVEAIGQYISMNGLQGKLLGGGFDLVPKILEYIKDGSLQFTIGQDPYAQGFYPIIMLYNYLEKGVPPHSIDTGAEIITKDNVDAIMKREQLWAAK